MRAFPSASITACILLAISSSALAEWGTTQGDASHSGFVPLNVSTTAPKLLWSTPGLLVHSQLAVGGSNVYLCTHSNGTNWVDGLYALNEQTGSINWKMTPGQSTGDPAYANGTVYLQNVLGNPSLVQGWNTQTQAQVFSAPYANQFTTYLAPVVNNGSLYAGGGYYGGVYSYNTATSATNWSNTAANYASYGGWTPAVDASHVYAIGGGGSDLMIYDKSSGALLSETGPHAEELSGSPVLTGNNGLFYITNGSGEFFDISNPASPQLKWSFPNLYEWDYPAYANGTLFVSANLNTSPILYALDAATGQTKWSLTGLRGFTNLVATNNILFAEDGSNTLAIDINTHQVDWSVPQIGNLTLSDNTLFIGSDNGNGFVTAYALPEPSSLLLLAAGALPLFYRKRR